MNQKILYAISFLLLTALVTGCIHIAHPDGRVERRWDTDATEASLATAAFALESAIRIYNLYRAVDETPETYLSVLLDDVERALELANRIATLLGEPLFEVEEVDGGFLSAGQDEGIF